MNVNTAIAKHYTDLFYRYPLSILKETGQFDFFLRKTVAVFRLKSLYLICTRRMIVSIIRNGRSC